MTTHKVIANLLVKESKKLLVYTHHGSADVP